MSAQTLRSTTAIESRRASQVITHAIRKRQDGSLSYRQESALTGILVVSLRLDDKTHRLLPGPSSSLCSCLQFQVLSQDDSRLSQLPHLTACVLAARRSLACDEADSPNSTPRGQPSVLPSPSEPFIKVLCTRKQLRKAAHTLALPFSSPCSQPERTWTPRSAYQHTLSPASSSLDWGLTD